ncbi:MAG: L-seryl-tRNA(Sec) selenium transferase, partial [Deltaproteobacteria bacterium]
MEDSEKNRLLRRLPSVEALLEGEPGRALAARHGRPLALRAARRAIAQAREALLSGASAEAAIDGRALAGALALEARPGLRPVLNATGVVLHTNLGRAPLAREAAERVGGRARL